MFLRVFFLLLLIPLCGFSQEPELTIQLGHNKLIYDVAFSSDGQYVASASADRTVKVWDVASGKELKKLRIDKGYATSVDFHPSKNQLLIGGGDYDHGELLVWDYDKNEVLHDLDLHKEYAWKARYSPDGSKIICTSFDGSYSIWNSENGKLIKHHQVSDNILRGMDVDPKGRYFAFTEEVGFVNEMEDQKLTVHFVSLESGEIIPHNFISSGIFDPRELGFSQSGKYLMIAGYSGGVMVIDSEAQEVVQNILAHDDSISDLQAGLTDQTFFTSSHDNLIKEWNLKNGELIQTLSGHKDRVYALDLYQQTAQLLSGGSFDKSLKLWEISTAEVIQQFSGNIYPVKKLILSKDDRTLIVNSYDDYGGDVYITKLNQLNKVRNTLPIEGHFNRIAFQPNSEKLFASTKTSWIHGLTGLEQLDWHTSIQMEGIVESISFYQNSDELLVGSNERIGDTYSYRQEFYSLSENQATPIFLQTDLTINDFRYLSPTERIYLGRVWESWSNYKLIKEDSDQVQYTLLDSVVNLPSFRMNDLASIGALFGGNKIQIIDLDQGQVISTIKLADFDEFDEILDVHFIPNTNEIALCGGSWSSGFVAVYNYETGQHIKSRNDFGVSQNAVTVDSERKKILTGGEDAKIEFLDYQSLETIVTLIHFADTNGDWAAFHPSGLFDGSSGAIEEHLYFTTALEIIELSQLKERYYEPGLLQKTLGYNEEPIRDVLKMRSVQLYPKANLEISDQKLQVVLTERNGGIGKVSLLINQKEMVSDVSILFKNNRLEIDLNQYQSYLLPGDDNIIDIITSNQDNSLVSPKYSIAYTAPKPRGFVKTERPSLYAIIVGTSDYRGSDLDLNFADKDAEDIANAIQVGGGALFGDDHTHVTLLHSTKENELLATKKNIEHAYQSVAQQSKPGDIIIVYFSGHGVAYGDPNTQFYYLTKDVATGDISDSEIRDQFTISTENLTDWINAIPAQKQVLILDACSSGQAVEDLLVLGKNITSGQIKAFDRMKDRTGLFIITGSAADKRSYEASQYGQSLLTYSLISGLHEVSATHESKMVDLLTWLTNSKEKVPNLAKSIGGIQEPVLSTPRTIASFDIAQITEPDSIPLAQIKPIFVRSTLMDLDEQDDVLALSDKIDDHFRSMSSKGKRAGLIFFDVRDFPNAYSLKGFYSSEDSDVTINVTLRKGEEKIGKINFTAPKSDTEQITKTLIKKINELIK